MTHEITSPLLSSVPPLTSPPTPMPVVTPIRRLNGLTAQDNSSNTRTSVADIYLSTGAGAHERPKTATLPQPAPPVYAKDWGVFEPSATEPSPVAQTVGSEQGATSFQRTQVMNTAMPHLGVLDTLLANDAVHDILVNGTDAIYIDAGGELTDSGLRFASHDDVWNVAETILKTAGQRWDASRPMVDTRLPDGSRVNIVAPPMSVDGVSISIRKFPKTRVTIDAMVAAGQLTQEIAEFLRAVVADRLNIVVSGGTGSGQTTLLNALSSAIGSKERIVTIEDSAELRLQQPHVVRLEATETTIRDLVKNALRMRPDRIIVGESRGAEAFDMLQAMNTGHDGSMTSLHANSPRDALGRLETMVTIAMPQVPLRMVRAQIANTLQIIIQIARTKDGQRRISHISEVGGLEGDTIIMQDLIVYREADKNSQAEYKWVAGSSRNALITNAAQQAGLMRGFK